MSEEHDVSAADTMRERAGESRTKIWLLLGANRLGVAAGLSLGIFVAFVLGVEVLNPPFTRQIASGDFVETLFTTMITVIVTGTTLVVTIGQLVLSQENGPLGDQRRRMSNAMDVRDYVEELIGEPSPPDPSTFLDELIGAAASRAKALDDHLDGHDDEDLREEVGAFAESLRGNADAVRSQLDGARFGTFGVLFAALDFNYSWKIFQVERITAEHEESIDAETRDLFDELKTALTMFGPAREHVKTLYFQWALIELSQMILYAAVPALAVAAVMAGVVDAGTFPGHTLGVSHAVLAVGGALTVTLLPFMLFVSYILRIVVVAKRTLAIGPLILRESQR